MIHAWARRADLIAIGALAIVLCLVPWTGYAWGDGLEFVAVSSHLGIAHPTGYPLFTLISWLFIEAVPLSPYRAVLLFCRLAILGTGTCVILSVRELWRQFAVGREDSPIPSILAVAFCFSGLMLAGARMVEVYALNGFFLSLLILLSLRSASRATLLLAGVAMGLSASHHLTSLCMGPLVLLIFLRGCAVSDLRYWAIAGVVAMIAIPTILYGTMPLRIPEESGYGIFWNEPRGIVGVGAMIRGGEYRQFQFLMESPNRAFTAATYLPFAWNRVVGLSDSFGGIYFGRGATSFISGLLVLAVVGYGIAISLRRRGARPWSICLIVAGVLQLAFVFTYNIPDIEDYFLGVHLVAFPFLLLGLGVGLRGFVSRWAMDAAKVDRASRVLAGALAVVALLSSFSDQQGDARAIHQLWRERLLAALPQGAAIVTRGDADTYTIWHEQFAEKERLDVLAYGANFSRFPWFRMTMNPKDPRRGMVGFRPGLPNSAREFVAILDELAISPLVSGGPVYTTINDPDELGLLAVKYGIVPAAELLTAPEIEGLLASGSIQIAPPVLYRIDTRMPTAQTTLP